MSAEINRGEISSYVLQGVNFISLPTQLGDDRLPILSQEIGKWSTLQVELHVLDFRSTRTVSNYSLSVLHDFASQLQSSGKSLISAYMPETIYKEIQGLGLEEKFNRIAKFPDDLKKRKPLAQVQTQEQSREILFRYLMKTCTSIVPAWLRTDVTCSEDPNLTADKVALDQYPVLAQISVTTGSLSANFRLFCPGEALQKLTAAAMGVSAPLDKELIEGMLLELLNIVYGHTKARLNDVEAFGLPPAIPRLIKNSDYGRLKRGASNHLKILKVSTHLGDFYIEVDFLNN